MHTANNQSGSFSGVWQIFLYNWHFYAAALVLDLIAVVYLVRSSPSSVTRLAVMTVSAIASFWAVSSFAGVLLHLRSLAFVSMELVGNNGEGKSR